MFSFDRIDEVQPSPQFGNTGPDGWGFTLWGDPDCAEEIHRRLLETLTEAYPAAGLSLPPWEDCEDLIEGSLTWKGCLVWVWFETVLNYTWLRSADRAAVASLKEALLPIARSI